MSGAGQYPDAVLELRDLVNTYLDPDKVALVLRAYTVGAQAHQGQTRRSGEPYILHPVAVAKILANLRMDYQSIVAAILHDTLEDTPLTKEQVVNQFGEAIADLVDGVTKLDKMKFRTRLEATAESFRKLMLAMSRDLRVIFIKLADRLHNMRTMGAMSGDSRRRIARETLDIYAPIADRLGMNTIKNELEDLGFANLYPMRHEVISNRVKSMMGSREDIVEEISRALKKKLNDAGIPGRILGREKTPYSIYQKMIEKNLTFSEVMDVIAFRAITFSEQHCYQALGAVHALYQPIPGRFKDYIALPKANGYQSLHTVLKSAHNIPIEIQIRTEEMDLVSEKGAAAHWHYKSGSRRETAQVRAREWLLQLVDTQRHTGDSLEFMESAKSDLFPDEIFVFTPKGKIIDLRRNSTALDFAYAIHTAVGNRTCRAIVDRVEVPLSYRLRNGQTIEIQTDDEAHPRPEWFGFVATSRARAAIRHYLKNLEQEDTIELGHRLLDKAMSARDAELDDVPPRKLKKFLKQHHFKKLEDLLISLARGEQLANLIAAQLAPDSDDQTKRPIEALSISGSEGGSVSFANCCHPIPGDDIMGHLSAGKGIVIHQRQCKNVRVLQKNPDRCLDVVWAPILNGSFQVVLRILTKNGTGVLASISQSIGEADSNIVQVEQPESNPETATLLFTLAVKDRDHMARVMRRVKRNKNVLRVSRVST